MKLKTKLKRLNEIREIYERLIELDGLNLEFAPKQYPKLCLMAVQNNGLALEFVKKQTYIICEKAVKNNINALQFVRSEKIRNRLLIEKDQKKQENFISWWLKKSININN